MKKITAYLQDFIKALCYGSIIAIATALIIFLIGLAVKLGNLSAALAILRSGMFLIGGFGLFVTAGMILMKKDITKGERVKQWREHFKAMKDVGVIIVVCGCILAVAIVVDYITFYH